MPRVLLVILWIGVTIYAIADWARTPEEEMPGRLPRMMWLIILLLTIPSFSIGSIVWLIVRAVNRSESGGSNRSFGQGSSGPLFPRPQRAQGPARQVGPSAPDDDPEFLFRLERDIRRKRQEEERAKGTSTAGTSHSPSSGTRSGGGIPLPMDEGGAEDLDKELEALTKEAASTTEAPSAEAQADQEVPVSDEDLPKDVNDADSSDEGEDPPAKATP